MTAGAAEAIARWRAEPETFVRQVCGVEPDAWQLQALGHVRRGAMRLALKACKGPGKSTLLAWLGWWWLTVKPHPKAVATSITGDNLTTNLWAELAKWRTRSPLLSALFEQTTSRIASKQHPETWFLDARSWPKDADTARQAESLAGVHADHVLFLIDEVGSIPDAVVVTAEAALANVGQGRTGLVAMAGNPTETSGPLWRAFGRSRHLWATVEITADPDDPNRTPRVSVEESRRAIAEFGPTNPWVLVNVFGRFPPTAFNALMGPDEVESAQQRVVPPAAIVDLPLVLGLDCASEGDDESVLVGRRGQVVFRPSTWRGLRPLDLADQVALEARKLDPDALFVDQGSFGVAVVDHLQRLGVPGVIGVDFGGTPMDGRRWFNRRAEMWGLAAEALPRLSLPRHELLAADLVAPRFKLTAHQQMQIEAKKDIKKRLGRSPDYGDALALTFAAPVGVRPRGLTKLLRDAKGRDYSPI